MNQRVLLETGRTRLEVDPADGARLTSLIVHDHELLVLAPQPSPLEHQASCSITTPARPVTMHGFNRRLDVRQALSLKQSHLGKAKVSVASIAIQADASGCPDPSG